MTKFRPAANVPRFDELFRLSGREISWLEVGRTAQGMFPTEIVQRLCDFGAPTPKIHDATSSAAYTPELHPLEGEWYFTQETAARLAHLLEGGRELLLGVPTVAAQMKDSRPMLVDRSPFIRTRFPHLAANCNFAISDVEEVELSASYDGVLLDPPWYLPEIYRWLAVASRAVTRNGRIMMPLFGEGTRPAAKRQRQEILSLLHEAGNLEVRPNFIEYDTPLFERCALSAAGLQLSGPWRSADLVILHVRRRLGVLPVSSPRAARSRRWQTYCIGREVVKLREVSRDYDEPVFPIPGLRGYTLSTVSQRDPRTSEIDLWTSRNRVCCVGDIALVRSVLEDLAGDAAKTEWRVTQVTERLGNTISQLLRVLQV